MLFLVLVLSANLFSGMIGYGMAKAAVHQLMLSLQSRRGGLPKECTAVALLP